MDIRALKQQAAAKAKEARGIYEKYKDDPNGMPDAEATRYDELLDESQRLVNQANAEEERERKWNVIDAALKAKGEGRGRGGYADDGRPPLPHLDRRNTRNGVHGYSVVRAINMKIDAQLGEGRISGLEGEVHEELKKRRLSDYGRETRGIMIPFDLSIMPESAEEERALDTTAGAGSIPTILSPSMIDYLRPAMVTMGLGATVLEDMQGLFDIPRQSGTGTGYWVGEGADVTASGQTIDQVAFSPKTVGGLTDYTRRFLSQTSINVEQFVRKDLGAVLGRAVELGGINGPGTGNQPTGVGQYPGVVSVPIAADGGAPTWDAIVGLETQVAVGNADVGSLAYAFNAKTRGKLKTTPKVAGYPTYLWNDSNDATPVNGYKAGITNLLPANLTKGGGTNLSLGLFGNWADLVYAFWTGIDVIVDLSKYSASGGVRIVALQDCDVNIRHAASFAKCVDIAA